MSRLKAISGHVEPMYRKEDVVINSLIRNLGIQILLNNSS